jgi:hypothetical protein
MGIHEGILKYNEMVSEKMKELSPVISWRLEFKEVEVLNNSTKIYFDLNESKLSVGEYVKIMKNIVLLFPFLKHQETLQFPNLADYRELFMEIKLEYEDEFDRILEEMDIDSVKLLLKLRE